MTLREFTGLTLAAKAEELELWAQPVAEKVVKGYLVQCYRLYDFYVEVYCDPVQGHPCRYQAFRGALALTAY
ncbi:hypothetical protein [Flaviaesturariibacter amylovorans]|uniref:Uncharacterized protein n=1 Tax=Flaviaesturariibacter amylovorans TaxID=1084520 RepID=A0ABP8GS92_9BACT